jgi:acyl-CoA thioesterase-1
MPRSLLSVATLLVLAASMVVLGSTAQAKPLKIVAVGDSLVAGYGLEASDSFPAQLERALRAKGHDVSVINAGVSGDTTAGGLARLEWALPADADAAILELGANDALRGLSPDAARKNLDKMLEILSARGLPILIAGMRAPNNWGAEYALKFNGMYSDLAKAHDAMLYPFFLEGVALDPTLNQPDGLHPNAKGVAEIVRRILPMAEALIDRAKAKAAG